MRIDYNSSPSRLGLAVLFSLLNLCVQCECKPRDLSFRNNPALPEEATSENEVTDEMLRQAKPYALLYGTLVAIRDKKPKNINEKDRKNYEGTVLHKAAEKGFVEIAKLLIKKGAKVDAQDKYAHTPLHVAAQHGQYEVAKILLEAGANTNAKNKKKWTPLHCAARAGHTNVVELLATSGADINAQEKKNKLTPLHLAVYGRYKEGKETKGAIRVLIKHGANPKKKSKDPTIFPKCKGRRVLFRFGLTPAELASSFDLREINQLLEAAEKNFNPTS